MKSINITFEDEEFEALTKARKEENWHDFIMSLAATFAFEGKTIIEGDLIVTGEMKND